MKPESCSKDKIAVSDDFILLKLLTLGSDSKNGPIHNKITSKIKQETMEASCVTPPTACCIIDLESDAVIGIHEKKEPNVLLRP